jgi:hypothetical protein
MDKKTQDTPAISRTALLKSGGALVGTAVLLGMAPGALAAHSAVEPSGLHGDRIEPDAGGWKT